MLRLRVIREWVVVAGCAALVSGCEVRTGVGARTTGPQPPPPPPPADHTVESDTGTDNAGGGQPPDTGGAVPHGEVAGGTGGGAVHNPSCPTPEDHCLDADTFFVGKKAYEQSYIYVEASKMTREPDPASGAAEFLVLRTGANQVSEHFWRTRKATSPELRVGQLVLTMDHKRDGIYRAPTTRDEAHKFRWFMTRIASVTPIDHGYVVLAGGYKADVDSIRFLDGDDSPQLVVPGNEDAHYLKEGHWFIGKKPLPERSYVYVDVAAAIQPPSKQTKGEGHFVSLKNGQLWWTANAWPTRIATKDDLKVGQFAFLPELKKNGVYHAPRTREEALTRRWWVIKIVDTSELYKGVVGLAGGYKVSVDAIRVVKR